MEIRNPRYNIHGTVDCEINHPVFGWIPFTASPNDPEEHGRAIYQEVISGNAGSIEPAPPPPEPTDDDLKEQARAQIAQAYRTNPPKTDAERIEALEIMLGLRDPDITSIRKK